MVADPHPAAVGLDGGEDVKSGFKPAGETVGDLEGFVHGVIGRKDTVDYGFCAFDGEVAVNSTMVSPGATSQSRRLGFRCCPGQERKRVSRKLSRRRRRRRVVDSSRSY